MKIKNKNQLRKIISESISPKLHLVDISKEGWQMEDKVVILPGVYDKIERNEHDDDFDINNTNGIFKITEPHIGTIVVGFEDFEDEVVVNVSNFQGHGTYLHIIVNVNKKKIWKIAS